MLLRDKGLDVLPAYTCERRRGCYSHRLATMPDLNALRATKIAKLNLLSNPMEEVARRAGGRFGETNRPCFFFNKRRERGTRKWFSHTRVRRRRGPSR